MSIDWTDKLETSHARPRGAFVLERRASRDRRCVSIRGDYQQKLFERDPQQDWSTVWHYNEDGTLDGDTTGEWTLRKAA